MLGSFRTLDRVLKGELTRPAALSGGSLDLRIRGLVLLVIGLGVVYGVCMGSFAFTARWSTDTRIQGFQQMLASGAKVPLLFFLTLIVTFPSLYVFNALVGSRLDFRTIGRLMVAALAIIMAVLASFGTITIFFSLCTTSYPFMVLLNVLMFSVAGLLGMRFLLQTLHRLSVSRLLDRSVTEPTAMATAMPSATPTTAPPDFPDASALPPDLPSTAAMPMAHLPEPSIGALDRLEDEAIGRHVKTVFRIWIVVFALVGGQMAWVLRPFIGSPHTPFTFFRERSGNVFEGVMNKIGELGAPEKKRNWRSWSNTPPAGGTGGVDPSTRP